jgi:hypothetical protein
MPQTVLHIPRLNDAPSDFEALFALWSQVNGYRQDVRLDFSNCDFLRPNAVAFLGGLARLIESRMGMVVLDWDTLHDTWVKMNLRQNGFAGKFGDPSPGWKGHSIPYREDRQNAPNEYADYLSDDWLGCGWVHVSDPLKNAIVERVLELYVNAFEHAESEIGVFSCGQHFPSKNELTLALVDFGVGIPATVRNYVKRSRPDLPAEQIKASACLEWAFRRGTTTRPNGTGRGLGLDLLKAFIVRNKGRLEIYSNEGYVNITAAGARYEDKSYSFAGTAAYVCLNCDKKYYCLKSEAEGPR